MARNIEIKARARDPHALRERAAALAGGPPQVLEQVDTFFHAATGRLKLRELGTDRGELIWYERANDEGPKESTYVIVPAPDPGALKHALAGAHGVRGVVAKRRELFLVGQTRVHIDDVAGLGHYVELEYVMRDGEATAGGQATVAALMEALGIDGGDLITRAYVDLLLDAET
jgi:adenylate cyclase